jgi:type II secretory ATPase GspE/PulE/Tfp pilus assembly ATPase PilB-like protein
MMGSLTREGSLGSILFQSEIITEDDIRAALAEQQASGCRFGEALLKLGIVTQEDIDWALSSQLNIPYVRLKREMMDRSAAEQVPAGLARRHCLVPLIRVGNELSIAIADPLDVPAIEELARVTGCQITVSVAQYEEIRDMLDLLYGEAEDADSFGFSSGLFSPEELESANGDLSGGRLLELLLEQIIRDGLASLALQPVGDAVRVTGRRAGRQLPLGVLAATYYPELLRRIRTLAGIDATDGPAASGTLPFAWRGEELQFRAGLLAVDGGDYVTLKLQISTPFPATWAELGLPRGQEDAIRLLSGLERGLVLVAAQNADERHRLLDLFLEDIPTEDRTVLLFGDGPGHGAKRFPRVPLPHARGEAAGALIAAAREHDPDILVVENATDGDAMAEAAKAAMGGRLVFAGLDLRDTPGLVRYLFTLWRRNHFIPTTLKGIVTCTGVRTLCPGCRVTHHPDPAELAGLRLLEPPESCCRPAGCPACGQTGYAGAKYLLNVITVTRDLGELFESAADAEELLERLADRGAREAGAAGLELLRRGEISLDEFVASMMM